MELKLIWLLLFYRYGDFSQFVEKVEELAKKLQDENLTSEEYKDLQAQFQVHKKLIIKLLLFSYPSV